MRPWMAILILASVGCDGDPPIDADAGGDAGLDAGPPMIDAGPPPPPNVRFVTFNVGNPDDTELDYPLRLSVQSYEDHIAARIAEWTPDVIVLQEVLAPRMCEALMEGDPSRTCFDHAARPPAARRLLGDDYSIVCDMRLQVECIGVHTSFGTIDGVASGELALMGAETPDLPLPACNYAAGECSDAACDGEATVSAVSVTTTRGPLRVVHMHPNASGFDAAGTLYLGAPCRTEQTRQAFMLAGAGPALMLGDWNFNPDSIVYRMESEVWNENVGEGLRFTDHSERDPGGTRVPTLAGTISAAIDHVVTDFAIGSCEVIRDPRVDAAYDFSALPGGEAYAARIDHRPVVCDLHWPD